MRRSRASIPSRKSHSTPRSSRPTRPPTSRRRWRWRWPGAPAGGGPMIRINLLAVERAAAKKVRGGGGVTAAQRVTIGAALILLSTLVSIGWCTGRSTRGDPPRRGDRRRGDRGAAAAVRPRAGAEVRDPQSRPAAARHAHRAAPARPVGAGPPARRAQQGATGSALARDVGTARYHVHHRGTNHFAHGHLRLRVEPRGQRMVPRGRDPRQPARSDRARGSCASRSRRLRRIRMRRRRRRRQDGARRRRAAGRRRPVKGPAERHR